MTTQPSFGAALLALCAVFSLPSVAAPETSDVDVVQEASSTEANTEADDDDDETGSALTALKEGGTLIGAGAAGAFLTAGVLASTQVTAALADSAGLQFTPLLVVAGGLAISLLLPAAAVLVAAALLGVGWLKAVPSAIGAAVFAPLAMIPAGVLGFLAVLILFIPPPQGGGNIALPDAIFEPVTSGTIIAAAATGAGLGAGLGAALGYAAGYGVSAILEDPKPSGDE